MEEDKDMWSEVFGINGEEMKTNNKYWISYALSEFSNEPTTTTATSANDNIVSEDVPKAGTTSTGAAAVVNPVTTE